MTHRPNSSMPSKQNSRGEERHFRILLIVVVGVCHESSVALVLAACSSCFVCAPQPHAIHVNNDGIQVESPLDVVDAFGRPITFLDEGNRELDMSTILRNAIRTLAFRGILVLIQHRIFKRLETTTKKHMSTQRTPSHKCRLMPARICQRCYSPYLESQVPCPEDYPSSQSSFESGRFFQTLHRQHHLARASEGRRFNTIRTLLVIPIKFVLWRLRGHSEKYSARRFVASRVILLSHLKVHRSRQRKRRQHIRRG